MNTAQVKVAELKASKFSQGIYNDTPTPDLLESISRNGVLVPIWIDKNNTIISGHRRVRACRELKLETIPAEVTEYSDLKVLESNRYRDKTWAEKLNEADAAEKILKPQAEQRMKAGVKVDPLTTSNTGPVRKYLARALKTSEGTFSKVKFIQKTRPDLLKDIDAGKRTISSAMRDLRADQKQERRKKERLAEEVHSEIKPVILYGDFRKLITQIPDNSIDLILTDPPYGQEYLPLWEDLSREAFRVLKPGKFLISYSGKVYLPAVLNSLGKYLEYYWLGVLNHHGVCATCHKTNMIDKAKPILFFAKPPVQKIPEAFPDVVEGMKRDKDLHEWGQDVAPLEVLLRAFTKANDHVLEPMAGGGSVVEACLRTKRNITAFEIEKQHFDNLLKRFPGARKAGR